MSVKSEDLAPTSAINLYCVLQPISPHATNLTTTYHILLCVPAIDIVTIIQLHHNPLFFEKLLELH